MRIFLLSLFITAAQLLSAQSKDFNGIIIETKTKIPIDGATVSLLPGAQKTTTDERGRFYFKNSSGATSLLISSVGHETVSITVDELRKAGNVILLSTQAIQLSQVTVSAGAG